MPDPASVRTGSVPRGDVRVFRLETQPPPVSASGQSAFRMIADAAPPGPVASVFASLARRGNLGALRVPVAFDPVVYVALTLATGEPLYVGRTYDLAGRIARHRISFQNQGAPPADLWAWARVPAPDAAIAEEALIRHLQASGHPAHLLKSRRPFGGEMLGERHVQVLREHGFLE